MALKLGTKGELLQYLKTFEFDPLNITVGYMMRLVSEHSMDHAIKFLQLQDCSGSINLSATRTKLHRVVALYKKKSRQNLKRETNINAMRDFLSENFTVPTSISTNQQLQTHCDTSTASDTASPLVEASASPAKRASAACTPSLRGDCDRCMSARVASTEVCSSLKKKLKSSKSSVAEMKKGFQTKAVNLYKKRKELQLSQRKETLKLLEADNSKLSKENDCLRVTIARLEEEIKQLKKINADLHKELNTAAVLKDQAKKIKQLERLLSQYENNSSSSSSSSAAELDTKMNCKQYSQGLRKAMYYALQHQVPVEAAGIVIRESVRAITGKSLTSIPDSSTAAQMVIEMGVLSDLQITEAVMEADSINLAWDATTVDGKHLNEIHLNTPSASYTLTTQQLAGGSATDYADQICSSLKELANLHADFKNTCESACELKIKSSILSTLTDRAAANHATVVQLQDRLNLTLLELNCHLHPLDGLANSARAVLKERDRASGRGGATFGKDCCAANLLYGLSKLRYKAKGDPSGFKAFLRTKGLAGNTFARYVGNRLHVLFHLAGTVVQHKYALEEYLDSHCAAQGLGKAVLKDIRDQEIFVQLVALAWLGKIVTGPWMTLLYSPMAEREHLVMAGRIRSCIDNLSAMESYPESVVLSTEDIFNKPLGDDPVLNALRATEEHEDLIPLLSQLLEAFRVLLVRQMQRYLTGPLAAPNAQLQHQAKAAPSHNIWAERCLGMVDAAIRRAPNATMAFVDAKVKFKMNKTMAWIDTKAAEEQQELISYAVKGGVQKRKRERERMAEVESKIRSRLLERAQKKAMLDRKRLSKAVKDAFATGGSGLQAEVFSIAEESMKGLFADIFENKGQAVLGHRISHIWSVANKDELFNGRILRVNLKSRTIVVAYWSAQEGEDDAEDYKLKFEDFVADIIAGDLHILD